MQVSNVGQGTVRHCSFVNLYGVHKPYFRPDHIDPWSTFVKIFAWLYGNLLRTKLFCICRDNCLYLNLFNDKSTPPSDTILSDVKGEEKWLLTLPDYIWLRSLYPASVSTESPTGKKKKIHTYFVNRFKRSIYWLPIGQSKVKVIFRAQNENSYVLMYA